MSLALLTPPAQEPLDLATLKTWARIDGNAFDPVLPMMLTAARQVAEQELGVRSLIDSTWRLSLDDWPSSLDVVPLYPVSALVFSYWNGSTFAALPANQAIAVREGFGVRVVRTVSGVYAPLASATGARVYADFTVGYGPDPEDVPQAIRQFIAAHVAYWVRNPEAATERQAIASPFLSGLLDPYRTFL